MFDPRALARPQLPAIVLATAPISPSLPMLSQARNSAALNIIRWEAP